jgi:4a-hydroxytetrahydrobiopterin dehydratase
MTKLAEKEILERLKNLKNWEHKENSLIRFIKFKDFVSAVKFIDLLVPIAEEMEHHPDLELKNYNELTIRLTTHDEGGVTQYDFDLAKRIEDLLKSKGTSLN